MSDEELLRQQLKYGPHHAELSARALDRIRELEAEVDALKSDLSGYMDAANTYVNELHGVHAGTHVIVPVEFVETMRRIAGFQSIGVSDMASVALRELRAAQPGQSD